MKKFGFIKGKDLIVFFGMLICGVAILCVTVLLKKDGNGIVVQQNGVIIEELSLKENGT